MKQHEESQQNVLLQPADIFLTKGGGFLNRAVRFFTRGIGEKRTKVDHIGLVVQSGDIHDAIVVVVEPRTLIKRATIRSRHGPPRNDSVAVYRATNITQDEVNKIVAEAESHVGKKYGYLKIAAHSLDWLLLGSYVFRRLVPDGKYPICSWVVAYSYSKVDKHFGVEPGAASPDDIWDFIMANEDRYAEVHPLKPLA